MAPTAHAYALSHALLGQMQAPAPVQRELLTNWMLWVLLVAAVVLVLLVLSRRQDPRVRR